MKVSVRIQVNNVFTRKTVAFSTDYENVFLTFNNVSFLRRCIIFNKASDAYELTVL